MFKHITIHLSTPLCNCKRTSYNGELPLLDQRRGLRIVCPTCKTNLEIPNSKFIAHWDIGQPLETIPEIEGEDEGEE